MTLNEFKKTLLTAQQARDLLSNKVKANSDERVVSILKEIIEEQVSPAACRGLISTEIKFDNFPKHTPGEWQSAVKTLQELGYDFIDNIICWQEQPDNGQAK